MGLFDSIGDLFGDVFGDIPGVGDAFQLGQDLGHLLFPNDSNAAAGVGSGAAALLANLGSQLSAVESTLRRAEDRDLAALPQSLKPLRPGAVVPPPPPLGVRDTSPARPPLPLQAQQNPDYEPRRAPVADPSDLLAGLRGFAALDPSRTRQQAEGLDDWLRTRLPGFFHFQSLREQNAGVLPQLNIPPGGPGATGGEGFVTGGGFGADAPGSDADLDLSDPRTFQLGVGPGGEPTPGAGGGDVPQRRATTAPAAPGAAAAATGTGGSGGTGTGGNSSSSSAPSVTVDVTVNNRASSSSRTRTRSTRVSRIGMRKVRAAAGGGGATRAARRTTKARTQPRNARRAPTPAQQAARDAFAARARAGTLRRRR